MTFHAAVWLDHNDAKVFHIGAEEFDETLVHAPKHHVKGHTNPHVGHGETREQKVYFDAIVQAVGDAQEILVLGPSTAKLQLIKHTSKHDAGFAARVVGVETVDHPTDGQLVAYVRKYFRAKDRMLGT